MQNSNQQGRGLRWGRGILTPNPSFKEVPPKSTQKHFLILKRVQKMLVGAPPCSTLKIASCCFTGFYTMDQNFQERWRIKITNHRRPGSGEEHSKGKKEIICIFSHYTAVRHFRIWREIRLFFFLHKKYYIDKKERHSADLLDWHKH